MLTYRSNVLLLALATLAASASCAATGSSECFVGANTAFEADAAGKRCCEGPDGNWGACPEQMTGSTTSGIGTSTSPTTTTDWTSTTDWTTTTTSTTTTWTTSTSSTDPLGTSSSSGTSLDTVASSTTASENLCGDSEVEGDEECDDGNMNPDDGCSTNCKLECGDGTKSDLEQCDDGNREKGDGCDDFCQSEWVIFGTSKLHAGSLGGFGGANNECAKAAEGKFPGTFVAWLFDGKDESVKDKLPPGPIVNAQKVVIANTKEDLFVGNLELAINLDENGMPINGLAWTGANNKVSTSDFHCNGWTTQAGSGYTGDVNSNDIKWTVGYDYGCQNKYHLYCFRSDE